MADFNAQPSAAPQIIPAVEQDVIEIVQRAVKDGRIKVLFVDASNDPVSEDLHMDKDVYLRSGQRLYFDNV